MNPEGHEVTIESLEIPYGSVVSLVGGDGNLEHRAEGGDLTVAMPAQVAGAHAYTLKIGPGA